MTFNQSLSLAVANAPLLRAREASGAAAAALQIAAGELPDPRLIASVDNYPVGGPDRYSFARDAMTMRRIGVMQEVPNAGKRAARQAVAEARTDRESRILRAERQMVRREAALAWLSRHYAERRVAAFEELRAQARLASDLAPERVASGRLSPLDALQTRQEALAVTDRGDELQRQHATAVAQLKRWTGVGAEQPLAGEAPLAMPDPRRLRRNPQHHVELASYEPALAMARAELGEAQAAKRGDWAWEVSYGRRGSNFGDMLNVQVTFDLPLWQGARQEPQILARQREIARIEAERDEASRRHLEEIDRLLAEHTDLASRLERLRAAVLPLADDRERISVASYEAGRTELGAVLAVRRERAELRLKAIDLEAEQMNVRARLAFLLLEDTP